MRHSPILVGALSVAALVIIACGGSGGGTTSSSSGGTNSGGTNSGGTGGPSPIPDTTPKVRFVNLTKHNNIRIRVNGVTFVENLAHGQFFDRTFVQPEIYWSVTDVATNNYVFGGFINAEYSFQVLAFAGDNTRFNWIDFPVGWATNAPWNHFVSTYTGTPNLDAGWRTIAQTDAQRTVLGTVGSIQSGGNALTASVPDSSPL